MSSQSIPSRLSPISRTPLPGFPGRPWTAIALAAALAVVPLAATAQDPDHDVAPEQAPVPAGEPPEGEAEAVRRETGEAIESVRKYTVRNREQALARARDALATLDREAAGLEDRFDARWTTMDAATRERTRAAMRRVDTRRAEAAEWVGGMRHASEAAWTDVRDGFDRSYGTLAQALREARREYERPAPPAPPREPDPQEEPFEQDDPDYRESRDAPG
jgi:hypothetical protein